ncbi:hypothetical protein EYR41_010985 [Orbilia oligospora]|uniref:Uncharacterized protein n=1 Tax=Orbilia oligospora TaxID=2813651 RepID=A0A7C8PIV9_ORBOL|nr:hypothetical protein TWF751_004948 [Orbilia oligospora]TGJ63035.1 hypothetical protein EYR41_010985 [Orbilia oligospora]
MARNLPLPCFWLVRNISHLSSALLSTFSVPILRRNNSLGQALKLRLFPTIQLCPPPPALAAPDSKFERGKICSLFDLYSVVLRVLPKLLGSSALNLYLIISSPIK